MNKLEQFGRRLEFAGLTHEQILEAMDALNEYVDTKFAEEFNAYHDKKVQQGKEDNEKPML